jgi:hypothetical protein
MWKSVLSATVVLWSCTGNEPNDEVALPKVAPDTVVLSWSVISQSSDRDSIHVALDATRKMVVTNKAPNGTMMSLSRTVSETDYAELIGTLRRLDCCSLSSTSKERSSPGEAKPQLEINFGDVRCEIELWDREWREGRARECGFAVARIHGSGFVPDPPVDEASP